MEWYYASKGQQQGPVSQEQLIALQKAGDVQLSDLVWNDSMADWAPFGSIPELAGDLSTLTPPSGSSPTASSGGYSSATPAAAVGGAAVVRSTLIAGQSPPSYLWQSIATLVCCCPPFGIVAVVFASKVEPAFVAGRLEEAEEASRKARLFCILAFVLGFVVYLTLIGLIIVGAMTETPVEG